MVRITPKDIQLVSHRLHVTAISRLPHFLCTTAAPGPPTGLRAMFTGSNTITVSWTPPSGGTPPTGYIIYYEATIGAADAGSATVSGASTSEHTFTNRNSGAYTVRIVALSTQLPSTVIETARSESICCDNYWLIHTV